MGAQIDPPGLTRRGLLQGAAAVAVGAAVAAVDYGAVYERTRIARLDVDLPVIGLPPALAGLRIGLITDVHHSRLVDAALVRRAVALLQQAAPDLVVLGGDYVSFGDRRFVRPVAELLQPLAAAREGAFAVLGNHDDDRDMPAALTASGFEVLKDERTTLKVRGERVDVAGIRYWTRRPDQVARVLRGSGPTTLLLAHDPRRLREAAELDVQLVLSGHTHGGQVVLPFAGAVAARRFPVIAGVGTLENTTMFVSRGVGTVYVPVRLNCPPDVTLLTLRSTTRL
jgi:predicted MPP superfamily phosphohydrolase